MRGSAAEAGNVKGSGVGLAMVRHIVAAHGGNVSLASEPGAGSAFTILLPAGGGEKNDANSGGGRRAGHRAGPGRRSYAWKATTWKLSAMAQWPPPRQPESAFDLILLDVMLPGKDGFEVCRELRRAGLRMPILMLTAKTQEAEKVMGLELGADDYVTKPFGTRELRAAHQALLRRAAGEPEPEMARYSFGNVELDFLRGELRRNGEAVELTPIEFKLLALFIRSAGRVLSRERLLAGAWGALLPTHSCVRHITLALMGEALALRPSPGRQELAPLN